MVVVPFYVQRNRVHGPRKEINVLSWRVSRREVSECYYIYRRRVLLVGPGNRQVLVPPSFGHVRNVKSQDERQWQLTNEGITVSNDFFKYSETQTHCYW